MVGVRFQAGAKEFLYSKTFRQSLGSIQPYSMDIWSLFLSVKRPEREAHHSPPSSAEVEDGVFTV
jgi:hypothetical protein